MSRYKINRPALLSRMKEYGQTIEQRVAYLQHQISVLMSNEHYQVFNSSARGYLIYYMLLNDAFELLRLNYCDYMIIVQSTMHEIIIEIREKNND